MSRAVAFERLEVGGSPVALLANRSQLLLEHLDPMLRFLRVTDGCILQLFAESGQLALGAHRPVQQFLSAAVRFLSGVRQTGRVARPRFGFDSPW